MLTIADDTSWTIELVSEAMNMGRTVGPLLCAGHCVDHYKEGFVLYVDLIINLTQQMGKPSPSK